MIKNKDEEIQSSDCTWRGVRDRLRGTKLTQNFKLNLVWLRVKWNSYTLFPS